MVVAVQLSGGWSLVKCGGLLESLVFSWKFGFSSGSVQWWWCPKSLKCPDYVWSGSDRNVRCTGELLQETYHSHFTRNNVGGRRIHSLVTHCYPGQTFSLCSGTYTRTNAHWRESEMVKTNRKRLLHTKAGQTAVTRCRIQPTTSVANNLLYIPCYPSHTISSPHLFLQDPP